MIAMKYEKQWDNKDDSLNNSA
ncbi:hypothetical protein A2U01_0086946, partial [Trifolium medium]|nr:hypothetical protein [Trifolium medium]